MVGELVFVAFFIYYLQKEVRRLLRYRPPLMYFFKFANLFEVFFLSLMFALIILWLRFVFDDTRVRTAW
jgi:hypothetical protein